MWSSKLRFLLVVLLALSACKKSDRVTITMDGSSTVFPISEAVAEDFQRGHAARVTIGVSGTGGGFKKFCHGEVMLAGASRPITHTEVAACAAGNVGFIELPIAYDGLTVVVNAANSWVDKLSIEELKAMWRPEAQAKIKSWNQIRPTWPDKELHLFGAGVDSGTYDYFTKAIVGTEHSSRGDYTSSEDDNILVQGISTDPMALGFLGYAYFFQNRTKLKAVPIVGASGQAVLPSPETVADGTYQPLSRPLFIYVSQTALQQAAVAEFVGFYLQRAAQAAKEVGYIALTPRAYSLTQQRLEKRVVGSMFKINGSQVGITVEKLLGDGA